ncbi:MAG: Peptidoglycan-N-acetylmuramic acid deacetylase PdaC [Elusimicrobia bacterium]|nr:Peptidoglycan-N-acetylmuramic acid deacetylase PdaC [Elusimicrobiota bacterium]
MQSNKSNPYRFFPLFFLLVIFACQLAIPLEWIAWKSSPKIALTFDDGPRPAPTSLLCELLDRYQAPSTFFVVGEVAAQYPEVLHQLILAGHEVANHSWSHPDIRRISPVQFFQELERTRQLILRLTGKNTFLFRTPGGSEKYLRTKFHVPNGYQLVLWDVHSRDQEGVSAVQIADRILSDVKSGDVILMHNGLRSTREALEIIIPTLQARGYEFVTVSELIRIRKAQVSLRDISFLRG